MSRLRKVNDYVYVSESVCKDSFSSWPSTRIFRITSIGYSKNNYIYWVYSYSCGLRSRDVITPTAEQIKEHEKLYDANGQEKKRAVKTYNYNKVSLKNRLLELSEYVN